MHRTRLLIGIAAGALVATMLPAAVSAAGPAPAWTRQIGTVEGDWAWAASTDSRGRVVVGGDTGAALPGQTHRGKADALVRVYTRGGAHAWTRQFGSAEWDEVYGTAADGRDRVIAVGSTDGALPGQKNRGDYDAFLRVFKRSGRVAWTRQFGTSDFAELRGVAVDGLGRIVVAGFAYAALPCQTHRGYADAFVRVYRPFGGVAWTRQFGTSSEDAIFGIAIDGQNRIIVTGTTRGAVTRAGNRGGSDVFVRAYQPNGRVAWTRQFGTSEDDYGRSVAVDRRGRVIVAGTTHGAMPGQTYLGGFSDGFVRVYTRAGRVAWTRQVGTPERDDAYGVATDRKRRVFVAGGTSGTLPGQTANGGSDVFLRAYRPTGRAGWTRQFGSIEWAGEDNGRAVTVDRRDRIVVVGETTRTIAGSGHAGGRDAFVRVYRQ